MVTSIPENDGSRSNGYTLAPNAASARQRLQRAPPQPARDPADCRYGRRSANVDRRRNPPTNRQRRSRAPRGWTQHAAALSIVDAAATSTAGAAAAPAKVGPTWRQGPCLHPEPKPAPLPPLPPLLPPAGRIARSDNTRDPPPAAATFPLPSSLRAGGDGEDAEAAGASS